MPFDLGALIFEKVRTLVIDAVKKRVSYEAESFLTKRKIENELEKSVLRVVEPLVPFLTNEKVSVAQQRLLIETCTAELRPLVEEPSRIFEGSLDGQKVVDHLYAGRELPKAIQEEGLQSTYSLLLPRIANLICSFPPAVKAWQIEGWKEGFKRLDQITHVLRDVSLKVDEIAAQPSSDTDRLLIRFRHTIIQRAQFKLELTGLRPDRLIETGNIEDFFVLPALSRNLNAGAKLTVQKPSHILHTFLSWNSRELIIGPPGSGKTTFASWLQIQHLSNPDPHLAIILPLRDLRTAQLPSLVQLVRESGGQHRVDEIEPKHVFSWLDAGRIAIICDGFDEIAPSDRDTVTRWLNDLEAAAGGSSVIITSRPLTSDHLRRLQKFSNHWEILPFDESRVIDYIQRWYMHSTLLRDNGRQIDVSSLGKTWLSDPVVGPLTGNPLVLTTLLVVHHLDGDLPKSRAKLYERYVEGMLGLWDEKRNVSAVGIDLSRARKHRILIRIALHFHLREVDQLNEEHLVELVEKIVNESAGEHTAANVLTVLRERTGLLVGPGSYSFVHKSVAEFLVAQAVIQGDQRDENGERIDRMRIFKERHNDRWNTILFFWAGLTGVGDLQDFVDSSLDVSGDADFKLVFGLLYDQIERLPINWTRGVVIQLLERGFAETASCRSPGWLAPRTSYSDSIDDLPPPRGISRVDPSHALAVLIKGCRFRWQDLLKSHSSILPAIWCAIVTGNDDLEEWQIALRVDPEEVSLPPNYYVFPLWRISRMLLGGSAQQEISSVIDAYRTSIPSRSGIIPLYLVLDFIDEMDSDDRSTDLARSLARLLNQIGNQIGGDVDNEWLMESRAMTRLVDAKSYDILTMFMDVLNEAVGSGLLSEDEDTASVREYIYQLLATRDRRFENQH